MLLPLPSAALNIHVLHWRRDCWQQTRVHAEISQLNRLWWNLAQAFVVRQRMMITWPLVQRQRDPEIVDLHWNVSNVLTSETNIRSVSQLSRSISAGCSLADSVWATPAAPELVAAAAEVVSSRLLKWEGQRRRKLPVRLLHTQAALTSWTRTETHSNHSKILPSFSFDRVLNHCVSVSAIVWIHSNTLYMIEIWWMS